MNEITENQGEGFRNFLISFAAFVIIIAGIKLASHLVILILLSGFIAIICFPPLVWLEKNKVPRILAFIIVIVAVIAVLTGVGAILGASINDFTKNLPEYQDKLQTLADSGLELAKKCKIPVSKFSQSQLMQIFDPGTLIAFAQMTIGRIGGILSQTLLIFIIVAFILFETSTFPKKFQMLSPKGDESNTTANIFLGKIKRYFAIKTLTSLATAIIVALGLVAADVDYPFLWGMLAFFLNFIPSIGSILAAIPVILLTLVQHGVWTTLWVAVGYTIVNVSIGNFIEPRFMGKELGLSPLVVFLSLIFWGWVLGPVGMFLSVPLTMTAKIAFDSREETRWIGVLLGP